MRHPDTFIIIFLFSSICSFAQSNFVDGYYISNEQDTVYGLIDNRGEARNGNVCTFKVSQDSEAFSFYPGEIAAYRITDGKYYVSREVIIGDEKKVLFLEFLVDGIKNLYFYPEYYFIENDDGELYELKTEKTYESFEEIKYVREDKKYVGQLTYVFSDCPELYKDIRQSSLTHKSLINLAEDYHNKMCDGEACIVYQREIPIFSYTVGFSTGISNSGIKVYYENASFDRSTDMFLGTQLYIHFPRITKRFSLGLGADYYQSYYYGFKKSAYVNMDIHGYLYTGDAYASLRYAFTYNRIKPVLEAGIMLIHNFRSEFRHVEEFVSLSIVTTEEYFTHPLMNERSGYFVKGGVDYSLPNKNSISLSLRYNLSYENYISSSTIRNGVLMEFCYLFNITR